MGQGWKLDNQESLDAFIDEVKGRWVLGRPVKVSFDDPALTPAQSRALHLFCDELADALNTAGYSVMTVLKHDAEIPFTGTIAKEMLWKPIQQAMYDKASTQDLGKVEVSDVYDVLARHLAQTQGIVVPPFPSKERMNGRN